MPSYDHDGPAGRVWPTEDWYSCAPGLENMDELVGLDSNALTYLVDAVGDSYLPEHDTNDAWPERVAMLRICCYAPCGLWVPPTARTEYLRLKDADRRGAHDRWTRYHLEDFDVAVPPELVEARAETLHAVHEGMNDCRIAAEVESAGLATLVAADRDLIKHLSSPPRCVRETT